MTHPDDHDLDAVDHAARAASRGLRAHVDRRVDPEVLLAALPASEPTRHRGRLLAAAAVAVLFIGSVAVFGDDGGEERSRLEVDEDGNPLPTPEPGVLTALGPNDGRDSIQLPITVEPSVDLRDGQVVTATGPGFVPGERVGIVQCAREAGGEVRERRAGIDGCNVGGVEYADADDEGVATGTFTVQRVLTTPATGTVDCALEAERCIVAMGALNDYDRSGGFGVAFAGGGEPLDPPTITVAPAEGLADGDTVQVSGEGFQPDSLVFLEVCSLDPSACWQTGEATELAPGDVPGYEGAEGEGMESTFLHIGLVADGDGHIEGQVPVWRYLPASAGAYVDCAVSACTLRATADTGYSPAPAPLHFTAGGTGPRPPAVAVDPTRDLAPGQEIVVRGAGFEAGSYYSISLCVTPVGQPDNVITCMSADGEQNGIEGDGTFAELFEVPDLGDLDEYSATTVCAVEGDCTSGGTPSEIRCDGVETECSIQVDAYQGEQAVVPPQFRPAPVPVTFRS